MDKLRQKILGFIYAPKDVPLLAGFTVGLYMILYYYSKNFDLANSWVQLGFFIAYYIVAAMAVLYVGYKILGYIKKGRWQKQFLFVGILGLMAFYLLQLSWPGGYNLPVFSGILAALILLSYKVGRYYKLFVVLIAFMALFNLKPLARVVYVAIITNNDWKKQPDDIETAVFKHKPNIYYIQPDGYTSFSNLRDSNHKYNNAAFEGYLKGHGFTLYDNYRSNYCSTLLSNSSMFNMRQHYLQKDIETYAARQLIVGKNPVLDILKKNGYTTHFITEKPYLLINRPTLGYDYCNISYSEMPFIKDGFETNEPITRDFYKAFKPGGGQFYFLEKITPGHINVLKGDSMGAEAEKKEYFKQLEEANKWLTGIINTITAKDPDGIIIIAADHGGFAGFDYTLQSEYKTENPLFIKAAFGAMAAIKWNSNSHAEYDAELKSSVDLFRTVIAFMAKEKKYLEHMEEDGSYIRMADPKGLYRVIDARGNVVLQKKQ